MEVKIKDGRVIIYNYSMHTKDVFYITAGQHLEFIFKDFKFPCDIDSLKVNGVQATKNNLDTLLADIFVLVPEELSEDVNQLTKDSKTIGQDIKTLTLDSKETIKELTNIKTELKEIKTIVSNIYTHITTP